MHQKVEVLCARVCVCGMMLEQHGAPEQPVTECGKAGQKMSTGTGIDTGIDITSTVYHHCDESFSSF